MADLLVSLLQQLLRSLAAREYLSMFPPDFGLSRSDILILIYQVLS